MEARDPASLRAALAGLLIVALAMPAAADLGVAECHLFTATRQPDLGVRDVLRLPPSSRFLTIGRLDAELAEASDQVVQAAVWLAPGNAPGGRLELEVRVGDRRGARSSHRVPGRSPHTVQFQSFFADVSPGRQRLEIRGRNLSDHPIDLFGFWIGPLSLPAEHDTREALDWESVVVDRDWREIGRVELAGPGARALVVADATLLQGPREGVVEYRIVGEVDATEMRASVSSSLPETHQLATFLRQGERRPQTLRWLARSDRPIILGERRLQVQTLPDLPVLEGRLERPTVVPSDGRRYLLASSGWQLLGAEARGNCGDPGSYCDGRRTHGWGWSRLLLEGGQATESMSVLRLVDADGAPLFCPAGCGEPPCGPGCPPGDIGIATVATFGERRLGGGPSAWVHVGLSRQDPVAAVLEIHGSCTDDGGSISVLEAGFEVLVLPDDSRPRPSPPCTWNEELLVADAPGALRRCFEVGNRSAY